MRKLLTDKGYLRVVFWTAFIVAVVLVWGGWFAWQQSQKRSQPGPSSLPTANSSPGADKVTPPSDDSGGGYLIIAEWGVTLPLSPDISGAYYKFRSEKLADYVALYDTAFDKLQNANGVSCGDGPAYQLYSISRAKPENIAKLKESAGPSYKTFPFTEDYLFGGLSAHQAPPACADLNSDPAGEFNPDTHMLDTLDTKKRSFEDAFKHLQALP